MTPSKVNANVTEPIPVPISPNALAKSLITRNETRLAKLDYVTAGKRMRAFLRARYGDHERNTAWLLDRDAVDAVVAHFKVSDPA